MPGLLLVAIKKIHFGKTMFMALKVPAKIITSPAISTTPQWQLYRAGQGITKAMRSTPSGISINVPESRQLSTLLRQANSSSYPLIISASGLGFYRDLKLKCFVGPNLNELRALITEQLSPEDFNNIIISTFASTDYDHNAFVQSLIPGHSHSKIVQPKDLSSALLHNNEKPVTLITFGARSAKTAFKVLKEHQSWEIKWIQIDGDKEHEALTARQISTQPFRQGYESLMAIIHPKNERQEILIKPKPT